MENIINWYVSGERGISSETMAATALGKKPDWSGYPLDPADLNRCIKLVDSAPEVKEAFHAIASLSPEWAAIIENWDELRQMFIDEVGYNWKNRKTRAKRTYDRMQELFKASTRATA